MGTGHVLIPFPGPWIMKDPQGRDGKRRPGEEGNPQLAQVIVEGLIWLADGARGRASAIVAGVQRHGHGLSAGRVPA